MGLELPREPMGVAAYRLYASALAAPVPATAGEPPAEAGTRSKAAAPLHNVMRAVKPRVVTGPSEESAGTGVISTCRAETPSVAKGTWGRRRSMSVTRNGCVRYRTEEVPRSVQREDVKPKAAEGLAREYRLAPASTEEWTGKVQALGALARPRLGWDPYEVWRTRVKRPATVRREPDPRPVTRVAETQAAGEAPRSIRFTQASYVAGADRSPS